MKIYLFCFIAFTQIIATSAAAQNFNYQSENSAQSGKAEQVEPAVLGDGTKLGEIKPFESGKAEQAEPAVLRDGAKFGEIKPFVAVELQPLRNHQVVIFIDRSLSMSTCDCPAVPGAHSKLKTTGKSGSSPQWCSSRWDWCSDQVTKMAEQAKSALPDGFTVVIFGSSFHIHKNMTTAQLQYEFHSRAPFGGTALGPPLKRIFQDYFLDRTFSPGVCKPLLIGIITDGVPHDHSRVLKTIAQATQQMHNANEITVVFFLIGENDYWGSAYISKLMYKLPQKGAVYPIVKAVPFSKLEELGLARSLAYSLQAPNPKN